MLRRTPLLVSLAASLLLAACASTPPPASGPLTVHLLGINDFHGNLEAPRNGLVRPDPTDPAKTIQVPAGGAARLATEAGYGGCYNILEGFEGDKDANGQRNIVGGWRKAGLPWLQG